MKDAIRDLTYTAGSPRRPQALLPTGCGIGERHRLEHPIFPIGGLRHVPKPAVPSRPGSRKRLGGPRRPNFVRQAGGAPEGVPDHQRDQSAGAEGDGTIAVVFDQGEGSDILDAIVAEGRCGTCGTPWDRVVNVEGKRPVKIEGGCPNEVCVLGDW